MTDHAQALLRKALTLTRDDRAEVAAELQASLDNPTEDPAAIQTAWAKEIERRGDRVLAGESAGEPWEDVRERVQRRLVGMKEQLSSAASSLAATLPPCATSPP